MIFVDTGAWFALVIPKDPDHVADSAWLATNTSRLITTDYVVDETLTLLKARGERIRALLLGTKFFRSDFAEVHKLTEMHLTLAWEVFERFADKD